MERWQATLHGACAVTMISALTGCLTEQRYDFGDAQVELTADAVPAYFTEDMDPVYRIDAPFSLHISPPSDADLSMLTRGAAGKTTLYPRLPWVGLHDLSLQLDYAIQNNDPDKPITALLFVNGVNEFQYYAPVEDDLNQWERRIALAPRQRVRGTITDLEMDEIAIDLATVVNGAPNSNLVVSPNSQSSRDERVKPYVPTVVPGLVGVRAGIETTAAQSVVLELTVRVTDHHDREASRGKRAWMLPAPAAFTPISPVQVE